MSELTLTLVRLGLLVLLWIFVFSVAGVLRGDLYGPRVVRAGREPKAEKPPRPERADKPAKAGRKAPTTVVVTEGRLAGTSVPLTPAGVLLGRNPECSIVLDDDFASGRHARIYQGPEGYLVEDLGSTNGTFLDEQRVTTAQLVKAGSRVRIGKTVLELRR